MLKVQVTYITRRSHLKKFGKMVMPTVSEENLISNSDSFSNFEEEFLQEDFSENESSTLEVTSTIDTADHTLEAKEELANFVAVWCLKHGVSNKAVKSLFSAVHLLYPEVPEDVEVEGFKESFQQMVLKRSLCGDCGSVGDPSRETCGESLFPNHRDSNRRQCFSPNLQKFEIIPIKILLQEWILRTRNSIELLESGLRKMINSNPNYIFDVYDGSVLQDPKFIEEVRLYFQNRGKPDPDPLPIYLNVNSDGFNPFSGRTFSCWPLQFSIMNIPADLRNQLSNLLQYTVLPGPQEPKSFTGLLQVLFDELNNSSFHVNEKQFKFRLVMFSCDLIAQRKILNLSGISGLVSCGICSHKFPRVPIKNGCSLSKPLFAPITDINFKEMFLCRMASLVSKQVQSAAARDEVIREYGTGFNPLYK